MNKNDEEPKKTTSCASEYSLDGLTQFAANRLTIATKQKDKRTCRKCHNQFFPNENSNTACPYHPESYAGETAQRWLAPGDNKDGAVIHDFYTCCGGAIDAPGCCNGPHLTFDDPDDIMLATHGRRPGMGR